jgi:aryl-alcohol dehydrogenase-like predicted oxidoreductase
MEVNHNRREFMHSALGAVTALSLADQVLAGTLTPTGGGVPTRPLGDTGERVSILCLGGWHIAAATDETESIRIMHAALDQGMTFFDNAWDYHDGYSEEIMGKALAEGGRRKKTFLMTKNCERDYAGSNRSLDDSLRRLRTDYLDLWQFHEMVYDNDPDWVFEKGGLKAALEAQKAGKVRYIGFTGHKDPIIHLKMLNKPYHWASSQMPINVMDAHYRSFEKQVVPVCMKKKVGVIGMKSMGGGHPKGRFPDKAGVSPTACIHYALSLPVSTLVVGVTSMAQLNKALGVARDFKPMAEKEKTALLAKVRPEATDGRHELFKSTKKFDGPHHRRQHGFDVNIPA